jgi:hypothetical protein
MGFENYSVLTFYQERFTPRPILVRDRDEHLITPDFISFPHAIPFFVEQLDAALRF